MKNKTMKLICPIIAVLLCTFMVSCSQQNISQKYDEINSLMIGDTYMFGAYEQDNDLTNGPETIEWEVLEKEENRVLLISKYALDMQLYSTDDTEITWENSFLRLWLNSTFYDEAFSDDEKKIIATTTVVADNNQDFSTNTGNDTQDKLFLISLKECRKYFKSPADRICRMTPYAQAQKTNSFDGSDRCWWWLRINGGSTIWADFVTTTGECGYEYNQHRINSYESGIRPAMWVSKRP